MKSRITIEVDFDKGNQPIIQIIQSSSDDVRDNLIQSFLQSLQHSSRWCRILYCGDAGLGSHRWRVETIKPIELKEEMKLMKVSFDEYCKPSEITEEIK